VKVSYIKTNYTHLNDQVDNRGFIRLYYFRRICGVIASTAGFQNKKCRESRVFWSCLVMSVRTYVSRKDGDRTHEGREKRVVAHCLLGFRIPTDVPTYWWSENDNDEQEHHCAYSLRTVQYVFIIFTFVSLPHTINH
jgi:hypothetical protein